LSDVVRGAAGGVFVPSPSQRRAIEAAPGATLVLAGPGAGKTYCLIERISFLIERCRFAPERICSFTFTNKAAGEIASRLRGRLGGSAELIRRGTIHAFCADLLRRHGAAVGLGSGFGIADEAYQLEVLRRLDGHRPWHRKALGRFAVHRFRGEPLGHNDIALFDRYERFLNQRGVVDFDMLVLKAAEILERSDDAAAIRSRYDVLLVDEFQDLNPIQYRVVRALALEHRHVFAVGDHEQSIYSWAGADPTVFKWFVNDFALHERLYLEENRRCPHDVFAAARRLVKINAPTFSDGTEPVAERPSHYPICVHRFDSDDDEASWLVCDLREDRAIHAHGWGSVALLYRAHAIGNQLEATLVNAGIPCRLATGHALADDPIVAYVVAALRVIARPEDDVLRDNFLKSILPRSVYDEAVARAAAAGHDLRRELNRIVAGAPRGDQSARRIRRALADWRNLMAIRRQHVRLDTLVQELLSKCVGITRSPLDERHDEISDPADHAGVAELASRLASARVRGAPLWVAEMGGAEIAVKGMLMTAGFPDVRRGGSACAGEEIVHSTSPLGLPLAVFKALQLLEMAGASHAFNSFTTLDLETTSRDPETAEIVEVGAVRVREGVITGEFRALVKPSSPIPHAATAVHRIVDAHVAQAPSFATVWPTLREFCGQDIIVAHNGYTFDFRVLRRAVGDTTPEFDLCMYDTLPLARDLCTQSRQLVHLARQFGVPCDRPHGALEDATTLAHVFLRLGERKRARARKTAMLGLLDHLGVALALSDESSLCEEARMFRSIARPFALGRYSTCLEWYEIEQGGDTSVPSVDEVIERLGGAALMVRIRAHKSPEQRYPTAMRRLRRIIGDIPDRPLDEQLALFLERVALSNWDGHEPEPGCVSLLTLHSTKGLEFSRVYIVGVEDAQLPGGSRTEAPKPADVEEARRLLYVGMTRTLDRLVLTHVATRDGKPTRGHRFLDEMGLATPRPS